MFGGRYLHRTLAEKAGALLRSMVKNHPFRDGNKRMALAATEVFLLANGQLLNASQDQKVQFVLELAASQPATPVKEVARWLRLHMTPLGQLSRVVRSQMQAGELSEDDVERLGRLEAAIDLARRTPNATDASD